MTDYVICSSPHSRQAFDQVIHLRRIALQRPNDDVHGEWMGFLKVAPAAQPALRAAVDALVQSDGRGAQVPDLMNHLIEGGQDIQVAYTTGHWLDVDSLADLVRAGRFNKRGGE